jgi:site-specific DNA-methyltransferase (adenine-specific)
VKTMADIELILGDCLEKLKAIPDNSIDLVLTDPPYGIGETAEKNNSRDGACEPTKYDSYIWDKTRIGKKYIDEILRVSRNQIIFGGNYYTDFLQPSSCWIVWDKREKDSIKNDFADCEMAWCSFKKSARMFRYLWSGMLQKDMAHKEKRIHPTQKPIKLMEFCINNFSTVGQTILDPFMGSGTTGVAAVALSRKFIGMEIDPTYFKMAEKRIMETKKQSKLMDMETTSESVLVGEPAWQPQRNNNPNTPETAVKPIPPLSKDRGILGVIL